MKAFAAPMAVGDYCLDINNNKIIVNPVYQRSAKVWAREARSFFIESVILGYPIPKIFLYSKTDLRTKATIKEIVDGQQRSMAIRDFYNDKLSLSKNIDTEELRGKKYKTLSPEHQEAFLAYSLPIDQFIGVAESSVREAFRRMNSNNVPLNDEEKRHAIYQGPFKWFINSLASLYKDQLSTKGIMSARELIRMADYKLMADIVYAVIHGINTTKAKQLNDIYHEFDKEFEQEDELKENMQRALDSALSLEWLTDSNFSKAHVFYALVLAHYAAQTNEPRLLDAIARGRAQSNPDIAELKIGELEDILNDQDNNQTHPFVKACQTKTNVKEQREIRIAYIFLALSNG